MHTYKEPISYEDTTINVQQGETERSAHIGVHTYKEPSSYEDTMINVQQAM